MRKLAIHGGSPIRPKPIHPIVDLSQTTIEGAITLLREGRLSDWYGGPIAREFERLFADYHGAVGAVAVNSGTSALHAAYVAAGIEEGDEVIVPSACYVSAVSACVQERAVPIICDVDPATLTADPDSVAECISDRTRLIVPVHLYGTATDMDPILSLSAENGLGVIEDCGQSHGGRYQGKLLGSLGDLACFSFAPRKHICTGQGGMVISRHTSIIAEVRKLVNKGKGEGWLAYERLGFSYAMPDLEALIGLDGLENLEEEVERRQRAVDIFRDVLSDTPLRFVTIREGDRSAFFKLAIQIPAEHAGQREFIVTALEAENVSARPPHPPAGTIPWVRQYILECGAHFGTRKSKTGRTDYWTGCCPTAEAVLARTFEVETGPQLPGEEAERSATAVRDVWEYVSVRPYP